MATYQELYDLMNDTTLRNRVTAACLVAAEAVRTEAANTVNHANRLAWAKQAFMNARAVGEQLLPAILAQNATFTKAQIQGATDAAVLNAVNLAIDVFATGG